MARKVNTGIYIDADVLEAVDRAAEETKKRNHCRWGRSQQIEFVLAQAHGVKREEVKPYFPPVSKPSRK